MIASLRANVGFIVLLAVAAVGAWFYVHYRTVVADRDDVLHRAELICAKAGRDFAGEPGTPRGTLCAGQVAGLAQWKANAESETARVLAAAMAAHDARQLTDNRAARDAAEAANAAATRMENADAKAERLNLVDADWFAALNGTAGLRAPSR